MRAYRHMMARVGGVLLLACAAFFFAGTSQAEAAFIAYICDDAACAGGGDIVTTDEGGGDAAPGAVGVVSAGGTVAGYEVTLNLSTSKPVVGSASNPAMNMTYTAINLVGASAPIWFYSSDTDFVGIQPLKLVFNAAAGATASAAVYGGSSNANLDLTTTLASSGPLAPPTGDVFLNTPVVGLAANPYSLTVGVNTSSPNVASGDLLLVPEPAAMSLFGLGLLGAAVAARRRMKRQTLAS